MTLSSRLVKYMYTWKPFWKPSCNVEYTDQIWYRTVIFNNETKCVNECIHSSSIWSENGDLCGACIVCWSTRIYLKFHNLEAKVPIGRWRQRKHQNIPWDSRPIAWHTPQPRHFPCHFKQRHLTKILRFLDQWQGHPSNGTDAQHPFLVKKGGSWSLPHCRLRQCV